MPTITIPVQADPDTGTLAVNGNGNGYQIDVSENSLPYTIQWDLSLETDQTGSFNSLSDADHPGFSWTYTGTPKPPPGFSQASEPSGMDPPGTRIELTDTHTAFSNNDGTWSYGLCATVNGTLCQTNPTIEARAGDPTIHNQ